MWCRLIVQLALVIVVGGDSDHECLGRFRNELSLENPYGVLEFVTIDDTEIAIYCVEDVQYRDIKIEYKKNTLLPVCLVGDLRLNCSKEYRPLELDNKRVRQISCYDSELNEENLSIIDSVNQTKPSQNNVNDGSDHQNDPL